MKIAVISDLHLGSTKATNLFGHDDAEFLRFLDHLEGNFERVVLLGDIWETLTSIRPGAQALELDRCRAAHPEIARRFDTSAYTYLHGNHDFVAGKSEQRADALHLEVDGVNLMFAHGHQFDPFVQRARWFSEWLIWMGGWAMRMGLSPIVRLGEKLDMAMRAAKDDPKACRFQLAAVAMAEHKSADIVVTAHTHHPIVTEHGSRLFMNSGSCSEGNFSFLSLDTKAGDYALNHAW